MLNKERQRFFVVVSEEIVQNDCRGRGWKLRLSAEGDFKMVNKNNRVFMSYRLIFAFGNLKTAYNL